LSGCASFLVVVNVLLKILIRIRQTTKIVRLEKCDVLVSCTGEWFEPLVALWVARRLGIPVVSHVMDWYSKKFEYVAGFPGMLVRWLVPHIERQFMRKSAAVIVPNEELRDELKARYGVESVVIYNPTNFAPAEFSASEHMQPRNGRPVRIRYTGALYQAHYDSFGRLLQAAKQCHDADIRIELFTDATVDLLATQGLDQGITVHPRVS